MCFEILIEPLNYITELLVLLATIVFVLIFVCNIFIYILKSIAVIIIGVCQIFLNSGVLEDVVEKVRSTLKDISQSVSFVVGNDERWESGLVCDVCNVRDMEVLRYCQDCQLYICSTCYSTHQKFELSRGHVISTCKERNREYSEIPLYRKQLEEGRHRAISVIGSDIKYTVSLMKLRAATVICVCTHYKYQEVNFVDVEDEKPDYVLRTSRVDCCNCNKRNCFTFLPKSGFVFVVSTANDIHFITAYVPLSEKLKNFSKLISNQFSEIRYRLKTYTKPTKIEVRADTCSNAGLPILCTEFNNEVAALVLKNNTNFGLVPNWSLIFYSTEGKMTHRCFLKRSNGGDLPLNKPLYIRDTLNNTLAIIDSAAIDKYIIEVDIEGNMVSKISLNGHILGHITGITCDDESNIYVCDEQVVIQISDNGQRIRKILSIENNKDYNCIVDICFSEKTHKLYLVMERDGKYTVVSFSFLPLNEKNRF